MSNKSAFIQFLPVFSTFRFKMNYAKYGKGQKNRNCILNTDTNVSNIYWDVRECKTSLNIPVFSIN